MRLGHLYTNWKHGFDVCYIYKKRLCMVDAWEVHWTLAFVCFLVRWKNVLLAYDHITRRRRKRALNSRQPYHSLFQVMCVLTKFVQKNVNDGTREFEMYSLILKGLVHDRWSLFTIFFDHKFYISSVKPKARVLSKLYTCRLSIIHCYRITVTQFALFQLLNVGTWYMF